MAVTRIQFTSVAGASGGTSPAVDMSGADFFIAAVTSTSPSVSDSSSNTWQPLTAQTGAFTSQIQFFYVENATATASHDFTIGGSFSAGIFIGYSGVATSSAFEDENGQSSVTSPDSPGTATSAAAGALYLSVLGGAVHTPGSSIDSGFSVVDEIVFVGGNNFSVVVAELIKASAGSETPTWTWLSANVEGVAIATFQAAGGGGGATWPGYQAPFGWQ